MTTYSKKITLYEKLKNLKNFPEPKHDVNWEENNYEAGYNHCLENIISFLEDINIYEPF